MAFVNQKKRKALFKLDLSLWDWTCLSSGIIAADDNAGLVQANESKNITHLTQVSKDRQENSPTDGADSWKVRSTLI